jgi:hypothetical protein
MVRILVATAMREATRDVIIVGGGGDGDDDDECHAVDDAILDIVLSKDRKRSGRAAPPDGLIFVGAAY